MPSNQTPNYQLSQWERSDKIQMEDFNADNAKIDAALKVQAATCASMQTLLNKKGNCSVGAFTYTGTGTYGQENPTQVQFPKVPMMYVILGDKFLIGRGGASNAVHAYSVSSGGTGVGSISVSWSGSTVSFWDSSFPQWQMNYKGMVYQVIAFYAQ